MVLGRGSDPVLLRRPHGGGGRLASAAGSAPLSLPRAPAPLPRDFAEALGHAVAGFGFLEEALKHAIHALSRDRLGDRPTEAALDAWVTRMEQIKGDSLGTLIESFLGACETCGVEGDMRAELEAIRDRRNMLCHASWKPVEDGWRPAFVSSRNMAVPERMVAADLRAIRARTLVAARRIGAIAREAGPVEVDPAQIEAERARARARAARQTAEQRPRRQKPAPRDALPEPERAARWHPLDADDEAARRRGRRHADPRRPRRDPEERR